MALLIVALAMVIGGAGPAEDVKARYSVLSAAVAAKDMTKLASVYTADATLEVVTPESRDRVKGLESVIEMWAGAIRSGALTFEVSVANASVKESTLTEKGTFALKKKDGSLFLKGEYASTWRLEKATWKLTSHQLTGR